MAGENFGVFINGAASQVLTGTELVPAIVGSVTKQTTTAAIAALAPQGTVTTVSIVTANGVSGSTANPTTTPAITITLGAITPSSVNGNTITAGTGTLTLSTFTLTVAGTASVSGTNTGDQTSVSGNAGTVTGATFTTALTVNTGTVTLTGNAANTSVLTIGAGAVSVSGSNTGDQTSVSGNAGTATALQNARTINGTSFNGTANITVTAAAGTLTGTSLNSTVVSATLTSITIPTNSGPATFQMLDGNATYISMDTRNTVSSTTVNFNGTSPTIVTASGVTYSVCKILSVTTTLNGTATVTNMAGLGLYIDAPTVAQGTGTPAVTTASNLFVKAPVVSGLTITNNYAAHFGGNVRIDGGINVANQATTITIKAATASDLVVSDGTTSMISVDTRTTTGTSGAGGVSFTGQPVTLASAASAFTAGTLYVNAKTSTLTGTTTTTSWLGAALYVDTQTFTDASACTLTTASAVHINALAAAGGSLTITNSYMISTNVAGCYLTNAGVWTSIVSSAAHKEEIRDAEASDIFGILDHIRPRAWKYRKEHFGDDKNRQRYGIISEELPEAFRIPGVGDDHGGVNGGILGSFALAALKALKDENTALKERLAKVEHLLGVN
jgi:hypothetical protein